MKKYFFKIFFLILCLSVTNISPAPRAGIRWYSMFCWLNSATQCLFKLKPLTELLKDKNPEDIKIPSDSKAEKVLREYTKLLQKVIKEKPKILEEKDTDAFYRSVVSDGDFVYGSMRDSYGDAIDPFKEIISYDAFSDYRIFSCEKRVKTKRECSQCGFFEEKKADKVMIFHILLFGMYKTSKVRTCNKCDNKSLTWEQTVTLMSLPEIIIIEKGWIRNISDHFEISEDENGKKDFFEIKMMDKPVLSSDIPEEERNYKLCGFIVWSGSHYWAYTKDYDTGKWYHNDGYNNVFDEEVSEEEARKKFEEHAYSKDKFEGGGESNPKVPVANVLFYSRAKDELVAKVTQLKQSLEDLSKTFNDLKKSLADISKKLS